MERLEAVSGAWWVLCKGAVYECYSSRLHYLRKEMWTLYLFYFHLLFFKNLPATRIISTSYRYSVHICWITTLIPPTATGTGLSLSLFSLAPTSSASHHPSTPYGSWIPILGMKLARIEFSFAVLLCLFFF